MVLSIKQASCSSLQGFPPSKSPKDVRCLALPHRPWTFYCSFATLIALTCHKTPSRSQPASQSTKSQSILRASGCPRCSKPLCPSSAFLMSLFRVPISPGPELLDSPSNFEDSRIYSSNNCGCIQRYIVLALSCGSTLTDSSCPNQAQEKTVLLVWCKPDLSRTDYVNCEIVSSPASRSKATYCLTSSNVSPKQ